MDINNQIILDESFGGDINLERKSIRSLPSDYINDIINVSTPLGDIWRYGSESFKIVRYPSDIDLKQYVTSETKNKDEAINDFLNEFMKLLLHIKKQKGVYLGDVKIGLNHIFDSINIGQLHDGKITGFDTDKVLSQMNNLYKHNFVDKKEYTKIKNLIKPYMSLADYDELTEELRNLHIIRWTEDELLREYKIMPPDRKYTLFDAMHDKTMVKIDVYEMLNGKYIEVSNFFVLFYEPIRGQFSLINLPENYFDLIEVSLTDEIEKFMFSTNFLKPMKSVKRMFSLARILNDQKMLEKIVPLLNSDCGLLYQINSELDLIATMLKSVKNPPVKTLMKQLDAVKYKMENITKFDIHSANKIIILNSILDPKKKLDILVNPNKSGDSKKSRAIFATYDNFFGGFDYINDCVENLKKGENMEKSINKIKEIKKEFQEILNEQVIKYLKEHDLYPPPPEYLPTYDKRKYQY